MATTIFNTTPPKRRGLATYRIAKLLTARVAAITELVSHETAGSRSIMIIFETSRKAFRSRVPLTRLMFDVLSHLILDPWAKNRPQRSVVAILQCWAPAGSWSGVRRRSRRRWPGCSQRLDGKLLRDVGSATSDFPPATTIIPVLAALLWTVIGSMDERSGSPVEPYHRIKSHTLEVPSAEPCRDCRPPFGPDRSQRLKAATASTAWAFMRPLLRQQAARGHEPSVVGGWSTPSTCPPIPPAPRSSAQGSRSVRRES